MIGTPQQDLFSHPEDVRQIQNLKYSIERLHDFIAWIFDNPDDEGIHWMSEREAWELFEKWEEKQNNQTSQP